MNERAKKARELQRERYAQLKKERKARAEAKKQAK